jgi:hypothetical protein
MTNTPTTTGDHPTADGVGSALGGIALRTAVAPLRFVSFWAAVALPFLYIPLLFGGFDGRQDVAFLALFGLNVAAVLLGHGYRRS